MDAGIPHRRMVLELPAETTHLMIDNDNASEYANYQLGQDSGQLSLSMRDQHIKLCLQMAQQATRSLHIFSYNLDASVFDSLPFLEAVKQLAIGSTNSKVYILLQEPKDIVLHGHRIVELARRLSSHILIHRVDEEDKKRLDNFLIADQTGVIRRPHSNRYEGVADFNNTKDARLLLKFFEEAWERSQPEPELRRLHL